VPPPPHAAEVHELLGVLLGPATFMLPLTLAPNGLAPVRWPLPALVAEAHP